ncbi:MAG: hypothetical protein ABJA49_02290, partial [Betaproteobacteria bacterium]
MKFTTPTPLQQEHQAQQDELRRVNLAGATVSQMQTPAFFEQAPTIVMYDALAQTLGAVQDGLIEYRYLDAVKLAGHS